MKHLKYFWVSLFILFLVSCWQKEGTKQNNDVEVPKSTANYQPPFFESDQRREKIKALAPEIHRLIQEHSQAKHIPGIAYGLVVDDELVVEGATGFIDLDRQTPANSKADYRIASMTKSFTAMAILKLRDEGRISLEDPVQKYIPEMGGLEYLTQDAPLIDINNLLTMTAGFPEDNPWGDRQLDEPDTMLMNLMLNGVSFSNVPSYQFEYSNTGYALLGHIVTKVSGMPYQKYISENILDPLGMHHSYWEFDSIPQNQLALGYRWEDEEWTLEPMLHDGSYGAMGGLITTIQDFSKYVSFHLSAWPPRNEEDHGPPGKKKFAAGNAYTPIHQFIFKSNRLG